MKIKVVVPITTKEFEIKTREEIKELGFNISKIDVEGIEYGTASIESRYSVRSVDISVLDLTSKEKLKNALVRESVDAIEKDGAILGCTGMIGVDQALREELSKKGYNVPVIYPVSVSIRYLEMLISLGLTHSKKTYMYPSNKERNIWDVL